MRLSAIMSSEVCIIDKQEREFRRSDHTPSSDRETSKLSNLVSFILDSIGTCAQTNQKKNKERERKEEKKREKVQESERNKRRTCDLRRSSRTKLDIRICSKTLSGAKEEEDDASSSSDRQQNSEGDERKGKHRCRKQEERNAAISTLLCYQSGGRVRLGERTTHLIMSPS